MFLLQFGKMISFCLIDVCSEKIRRLTFDGIFV